MKRFKLTLIALTAAGVVLQLGSCARFLGDVLGDQLWLRGID